MGARALLASIQHYDSRRHRTLLALRNYVSIKTIGQLKGVGWNVIEVDEVSEPWWRRPECGKFNSNQDRRWGRMMTKLHLWALPFERVIIERYSLKNPKN